MKKVVLLGFVIILSLANVIAQPPQGLNYQAVARDLNGDLLTNQSVTFRISILIGLAPGTLVYQEIHPAVTNNLGLVDLIIGEGIPTVGTFSGIDWTYGESHIKVEMDPSGGTSYQLMGQSELQSVPYALYDGDWEIAGSDLRLGVSGNVGIGTFNPSKKLEVNKYFSSTNTTEDIVEIWRGSTGTVGSGIGAGLAFRNQVSNGAFALSGRISSIMENAISPTTSAGMLFETRPTSGNLINALYLDPDGNVGLGTTNPNRKLEIYGDEKINYSGSDGNALSVTGSSIAAMAYIQNSGEGWGLSAGINNSNASSSYGLYGFNYGLGYGVYGKTYNSAGKGTYGINSTFNNFGYLGSPDYGAYGENYYGNFGYLGGNNYGVYGSYNLGNYGVLGTAQYGVYGYLITTNPGNYSVYGYGVHASGVDGTSYSVSYTIGGIKGYNFWGNPYTFGVAGYSYLDYARSGGNFGGNNSGTIWGSLAYKNSGNTSYGGYFTTYISGSGKDNQPQINNGIGAYGDLFGADIHGKVYGAFIEGENYATFANGTVFKNGLDVHLQENGTNQNTVLYTSVATDATIQTSGYASITNGKANISFDQNFVHAVSDSEPIIVTVTPMGNSNGVYLSEVSKDGFKVVENNNGKNNVNFSYIAIGKRKGFENPQLPAEVISADYTSKLAQGLHNDNDMNTDGQGLYYENGQLLVGKHPSTYPDLNKQGEEMPAKAKPERKMDKNSGDGKAPEQDKK
ncbi:MAG: hypothetical protein K9G76_06300 [Bacteroidales bacterium]|nr:hypothetical protein [Bacteroidales bacterium]MCF8402360.1 hypothetical protein [Bacteroidales bacterium]